MIFVVVTIVMFQNSDLDKIRNFYFPTKNELTAEELKYIPAEHKNYNNPGGNVSGSEYQSNLDNFNKAGNNKDFQTEVYYGEKIAIYQSNDSFFLTNMAYAYQELKIYDKAAYYWGKILVIDPNNSNAKQGLKYANYYLNENKLNNEINNVRVGKKAPAKIYALVKTNLGNDVKEEVDGILDLIWQEINGRIILQSLLDNRIPINILPGDFQDHTDLKWADNYKYTDVTGIDISQKTIQDLNNTSLSSWNRIYNLNTFLHEFGHAFTQIKDPKSSDSLEEELGVSMIGYNISYKIVTGNYMTDEQIKQQSMGTFQALLSDDHKNLPVYSGFNKRMKKYAIYMPNPALYTDLVAMYKQLLSQGKTQHVPNLDKLVR